MKLCVTSCHSDSSDGMSKKNPLSCTDCSSSNMLLPGISAYDIVYPLEFRAALFGDHTGGLNREGGLLVILTNHWTSRTPTLPYMVVAILSGVYNAACSASGCQLQEVNTHVRRVETLATTD